jgi:dedicator of cytokinesis protein 3
LTPFLWADSYVVSSSNQLANSTSFDSSAPSSSKPLPQVEPTVTLGIFPAAFVHIREELGGSPDASTPEQSTTLRHQKGKGRENALGALREEEEEEEEGDGGGDGWKDARRGSWQGEGRNGEKTKPSPPIPSLKAGDDTLRGLEEPLVDEIASALREWHSVRPSAPSFSSLRLEIW